MSNSPSEECDAGAKPSHLGIGLTFGIVAGAVVGSITGEMPFAIAMGT